MKLFIESMVLSAASTNPSTAEDETPWASGLLRGSSAAMPIEPLKTTSATKENVFMLMVSVGLVRDANQANPSPGVPLRGAMVSTIRLRNRQRRDSHSSLLRH